MTRPAWVPLAVGAVAAVGLAVRLVDPDAAAVTNDEAYSWRIAQYPVADLADRARGDANPPLYYLLLKAWVALAGDSLLAMRGLAAAFGALTVAAVAIFAAGLGRRRDWAGGLTAAALVAVHPLQVSLGRSARAYGPALFLAVASSYLLWRAVRGGGRGWWVGYGLAAGLFALTHHYALFTLAAHAAFVAGVVAADAVRGRDGAGRLLGRAALGGLVALAVYLPWLGGTFEQVRSVKAGFWIPELTAEVLAAQLAGFVTGLPEGDGAGFAAAVAVAVLAGLLADRGRGAALLLLTIAVPLAAAVGLSLASGRSILVDRYLAFAQLFFLCAAGRLVWAGTNRAVASGLAVLAVGLFAAQTGQALAEPAEPGGNLAALGESLAADVPPGGVIYSANPGEACQVMYYARRAGSPVVVKVVGQPPRPDGAHKTHATAIPHEDWVLPEDVGRLPGPTVTVVVQTANTFLYAEHWSIRSSRRFIDHGGHGWIVNELAVGAPATDSGDEP